MQPLIRNMRHKQTDDGCQNAVYTCTYNGKYMNHPLKHFEMPWGPCLLYKAGNPLAF